MLYEMVLPALLVKNFARRLVSRKHSLAPDLQLRVDRGRLRRLELRLISHVSPMLAAWVALGHLERINPVHRSAIRSPQGAQLLRTKRGKAFARSLGPPDAPRIIVLHGWNADGTMMLPLARKLADTGFAVILPDLASPGLTRTRKLDVQRVARRIVAECDVFGPYEAVIGHSAGGLVGAVAAREGLRVHRLVTISSAASVASLLTGYMSFIDAPEALKPAILRLYRTLRGRDPAGIGPEDYGLFGTAHLIVHGSNDWQVSPSSAHRICAGRANLAPILLPGCNHQSVLRHSDLADLIHRFVTTVAPAKASTCPGASC